MTEVQRGDPRARRLASWAIAAAVSLGAFGVLALDRHQAAIHAWLEANIEWLVRHTWAVFLAGLIVVLPVLALAAYLFLVGSRIARSGRYPAPGYAVARAAPVVTGRRAVIRGRVVQVLSALLVLCSLAIPVMLWYIFTMLGRSQ